jgi:hypothetical protein
LVQFVHPLRVTFDHYPLPLATDAVFRTSVRDQDISGLVSKSEFTPTSDLSPNTRYYWRVRAFNSLDQYSSWSTVSYFREAMLAPELSSPANAAALDNLHPAFDWRMWTGLPLTPSRSLPRFHVQRFRHQSDRQFPTRLPKTWPRTAPSTGACAPRVKTAPATGPRSAACSRPTRPPRLP